MSSVSKLLTRTTIRVATVLVFLSAGQIVRADFVWIEGEKPTQAHVTRHPWWYDKVQKNLLSGGDFISHWDPSNPGELVYVFDSPHAGSFDFWIRANPVRTKLQYRLNGGKWTLIDTASNIIDDVNVADDGKVDLRYLAWIKVGPVELKQGSNTAMFSLNSDDNHHGSIDCFVFTDKLFVPHGILKPDEMTAPTPVSEAGWFAFDPPNDPFTSSPIDLRSLNEKSAGDRGFIAIKNGEFVHGDNGEPVRFWGVNGPPAELSDLPGLHRLAKLLAKRGVNLLRVHGSVFTESGDADPKKIRRAIDIVNAMKSEGIYCHFSIYYYPWLHPKPGTTWLNGYDGTKPAPGALYFNPEFQAQYLKWWKALLLMPAPGTGKRLIDEPAIASVEILNEDSDLFWTFGRENMPAEQWSLVEAAFASWTIKKYGSIENAISSWGGTTVDGDAPALGKLGIRPMWQILKEKSRRDQDTARFLADGERNLYISVRDQLRAIGFRGLITASNWITADTNLLGPLDKYACTSVDFMDRHGYLPPDPNGDSADWSIRADQTFTDRSALRFSPHEPGKPPIFSSPVMDPHFEGKPSMLSEVAISRPGRYRSEAPLFYAAYGSLQGSNAIEHFAIDGTSWSVKPGYFMQPWSIVSPATLGQFPAAALIYRERLIEPGQMMVDLQLNLDDLFHLNGSSLRTLLGDEAANQPIDPLACFVGRSSARFGTEPAAAELQPISAFIDGSTGVVNSSNRQLRLDFRNGVLQLNAPDVQGVSGNLDGAGEVTLNDVVIRSPLDLGHIVVVSLDHEPVASSKHLLLQIMSEERPSGFQTAPLPAGRQRIVSIGTDPWRVKSFNGVVRFRRSDAASLQVHPLDANGYELKDKPVSSATSIQLLPDVLYYSIDAPK